jgi:glyoxylase-like metal-dependent hydrolase (beta-lactamase superfamily II)
MGPAPLLRRSPIPERPEIHQIVLPTPWDVGPVQVYLIEGDPLTLVDTGVRTLESRVALETALETLGHGLEDVRRILLTHYHGDHLGQAEVVRRAGPGLEVACHEDEAPMVENFSAERDERVEDTDRLFQLFGVPGELRARQLEMRRRSLSADPLCGPTRVEQRLLAGSRIACKDFALSVVHAPGHTEGHVLYHEPESGVLFTGDHIMGNAVPYTENFLTGELPDPRDPLSRPGRFRGLVHYMEGLADLRPQGFRTLLPAHGGIIERPERAIRDATLFYEVRIQRIERALGKLASGGRRVTAWEIWERLFPKADPVTEMRTRMYMVIGALDLLEDQERAQVARRDDGVCIYSPG